MTDALFETERDPRIPLDFYETPPAQTLALLRRVPILGTVYEPCAGDGAITQILRAHGCTVITNDIDPKRKTDLHLDATMQWPTGAFQWVVDNPAFTDANLIVPQAVKYATVGVAMLLRLSWLEPTVDRATFLIDHPPTRVIVLPRHSYKRNRKTDSVTSAWMIWSPLVQAGIEVVSKAEIKELAAFYTSPALSA